MTKKIFTSIICVAGVILLSSVVIIMGCLYNYFEDVREGELRDELTLSMAAVEDGGITYLQKVRSQHYRLTWISADGTVLYDTVTGKKNGENHLERVEVKRALETGSGQSNRYSDTLLEKTIYYAKRMEDGSVLRISVSSATAGSLALGMIQPILMVVVIALIMAGILADRVSKRIVRPLNRLDLEHPLENDTYEELSPLLNRMNRQHHKIASQVKELKQRTAELEEITACMKEGLVLLDDQGNILSINPAANTIFSSTGDSVGQNFLTVCRDREINLCIKQAMESGHSEIQQSRSGREYQLTVSRIESDKEIIGAALLIVDISEKARAEQSRREFTANVSHELKTPLQGIIGSAELMENGMVEPEDIPRFVGHIRKEAARLVSLVGDIIRLSQLDEKGPMAKEEVDLLEMAGEVCEDLKVSADEKQITLGVSGENSVISGVRKLLYEIIYNLCDNAVTYNLPGGRVDISVSQEGDKVMLAVSDTGIGIPAEHLERIFERFYRVDKSHSKESGGTGLGLSIVKNAAAYHRGSIQVQSQVGEGTTIKIAFPQKEGEGF